MNKSNICVVGTGYWGSNHLRSLKELGILGGFVEENNETLSDVMTRYDTITPHLSVREAIDSQKYTGFTVATPANTHYDITKTILEAGYSVLVEKPFALDLSHAEELAELSRKKRKSLMVGHLLLFHPAIKKIKKLIEEKMIGTLKYIYSNRLNFGVIRSYEDVFWSLAPHDISIIQYLAGSYPKKVSSFPHSTLQEGIADSQITHLIYPNNLKAHIFNSWFNPFKEHSLVIYGSKGFIVFKSHVEENYIELYKFSSDNKSELPNISSLESEKISFSDKDPLKEELKYFSEISLKNDLARISGIESALEVTKIMLACSIPESK